MQKIVKENISLRVACIASAKATDLNGKCRMTL